MPRVIPIQGHPEVTPAALGPAEADLDWFQAQPLTCVRIRMAEPGELDAQRAMHAAGGGELPDATGGLQGGLLGIVATQRVLAPGVPLTAGFWFAVELPAVLASHPDQRALAEAVLAMVEHDVGVPGHLCRAALGRQFPQQRAQRQRQGFG
ncbi:MAG: hypothetical protein WBN89_16695 [Prochlorococcaceae cyanobacterium]